MAKTPSTPKSGSRRHLKLLIAGPAILAVVGLVFYLFTGRYATTDNAYIKGDKYTISSEVTGRVTAVNVADNARVKAGDILVAIEKEPFEIAVSQAEANLATVRSDIESTRAEYMQKQAETAKAEEAVTYQQKEYDRAVKLLKEHVVSQARVDQVKFALDDATKNRDALQQETAAVAAKLGGDVNLPIEQDPHYKEALARLDKAKWDLSHIQIPAPSDGIAANVHLRNGEYIATGLPLFSVVDDKHLWIEANFKETDLTYVRPGQAVSIDVDAYPKKEWEGVVASITPATGSEFSILPAQNSSGNWVKVVQRVMVRIELKDYNGTPPLAMGMSCDVSIDTGHSRMGRWFSSGK